MEQSLAAGDLSRVLRDLTGLEFDPADEAVIVEQLSGVRLMAAEIDRLDIEWSAPLEPFDPHWPETEG